MITTWSASKATAAVIAWLACFILHKLVCLLPPTHAFISAWSRAQASPRTKDKLLTRRAVIFSVRKHLNFCRTIVSVWWNLRFCLTANLENTQISSFNTKQFLRWANLAHRCSNNRPLTLMWIHKISRFSTTPVVNLAGGIIFGLCPLYSSWDPRNSLRQATRSQQSTYWVMENLLMR